MARTVLTPVVSVRGGVALAAEQTGDATNNHQITNTGNTRIIVRNTGAGARVVTFWVSATVDGLLVTNRTKSIAAGVTEIFGPFPTATYGTTLLIDVAHAELVLRAIE